VPRFVTFVFVVFSATSFAEPNIGIVDLQRAIDASTERQAARRQLRALADSKTPWEMQSCST
jgi:RNase P protein component